MSSPASSASPIRAAWALFRQGEEARALAALGTPPAAAELDDPAERAMLAAMLFGTDRAESALAYLQIDWRVAAPDAAGLAGALLFSHGSFEQALPALRRAWAGPTRDPAAHALHLGRALILLGRAEEALTILQQGLASADASDQDLLRPALAEAEEALQPSQAAQQRQQRVGVERVMARFGAAFMASRAGWGHASRQPVFVLGLPHSGTALVAQILARHSQVSSAGESDLIPALIRRLDAWEAKLGSPLRYPDSVADLSPAQSHQFAEQMLVQLRDGATAAPFVIDARPHNFEHVGLIKLLFPNATLIHCRRATREPAVATKPPLGARRVDHERLMAHWHALFPGQIMELAYEELLEDGEAAARALLAHLGLPWEDGVLDLLELDQHLLEASFMRGQDAAEPLGLLPPPPEPLPLPELPPGLYLDGMTLLQQERAAEAQALFERLIAAQPAHAAAHQFLGAALLQQGRADAACRSMRRSVHLLPEHPSWWENLARAELAAGRPAAAQEAFEQAQLLRR